MNIVVGREESSPIGVTSGVPQGSVFSLVLFPIYINFVVENFTRKYKIIADDLKLSLSASSVIPNLSVMQRYRPAGVQS